MLIGILSLFIDRDAIFLSCLPHARPSAFYNFVKSLEPKIDLCVCVCCTEYCMYMWHFGNKANKDACALLCAHAC